MTPPHDAKQLLEWTTPGEWLVHEGAVYGDSNSEREGSYAFGVPILRIDNSYRRWGRDVSHYEHDANLALAAAAPRLARKNITLTERVRVLEEALRKLSIAAQSSGGVAGRDEGLVEAIDHASAVLLGENGGRQ